MAKFYPYQIHHIKLNDNSDFQEIESAKQGNYLIFWWKDIGLGQFYLAPGVSITKVQYFKKLIDAIKPTIKYYELITKIPAGNWELFLLSGDFNNWGLTIDILLAKFTKAVIPASVPVSVVICTRNRPEHLQKCLIALKNSQCVPEEIVVVDNAPDNDSTQRVAESFEDITYVREPRPGLDFARNTGIKNATSPVIAFTDDDVRVHPTWIYRVWETFQEPGVGAMTGLIIALAIDTEAQFIFETYWSFNRGYIDKIYDNSFYNRTLQYGPPVWEIGAGANMAFRKSIFETVGYFDELLDVGAAGCNGDSEMWFRILSKGFSINYNPRAITYHEHRKDLYELRKQIFYYMRGFTTAALIQQANVPEANYKKHKIRKLPAYYRKLLLQDFPQFGLRLKFLKVEILGILSGLKFYRKNRKKVNNTPLVSIIIPCYNYGNYLKEAINSIKQQNYPNVEIIVVDDGSTDNTQKVLKTINGVKNILKENAGLSAARNTGIRQSNGEFLIFLDADDWLLDSAILTNLSYMRWDSNLAFVSGGHVKFYAENNKMVEVEQTLGTDHYIHLLQGNYIGMLGTVMFRKWVFDKYLYDESLKACEDYDLYLRIARSFPVLHHTKKIAAYRLHNNNMSGNAHLMLSSVLKVLKNQKNVLKNKEEENAYNLGINTFKEYYKKD